MDAATHRPASLSAMDLKKHGSIKFLLKHIDGFVEYVDSMSSCTIEDFLGNQDNLEREKEFNSDSILCPNSPEHLQMLNSLNNHKKSQYLSLEFHLCSAEIS